MRLTENPVYVQLTQDARLPSLRLTAWLGFAAGLLMTAAATAIALALIAQGTLFQVVNQGPSTLGTSGIVGLIALAAAGVSGWLAARSALSGEHLALLRSTQTAQTVAAGCYGAALFRLRLAAAGLIALLPILMMWLCATAVSAFYINLNFGATGDMAAMRTQILIVGVAAAILVALTVAGWAALSAALGVAIGFRWPRMPAALILLAAGPLIVALANIAIDAFPESIVVLALALFVLVGLPWLLIRPALGLAARAFEQARPV